MIDDDTKAGWMAVSTPTLAARFGWSDQYRALADESARARAPQRQLARAVQGYLHHVMSLTALARLRGIIESAMEVELMEAGLQPEAPRVRWVSPADLPQVEVDLSDLEEGRA